MHRVDDSHANGVEIAESCKLRVADPMLNEYLILFFLIALPAAEREPAVFLPRTRFICYSK